jgi:antitoxin ChpS
MCSLELIAGARMQTIVSKWGNSLGLRLPKPIAEQAQLREGSTVEITVGEDGHLTIAPARRRVTLDELLAKCDPSAPLSDDERAWLDTPSVGLEKI